MLLRQDSNSIKAYDTRAFSDLRSSYAYPTAILRFSWQHLTMESFEKNYHYRNQRMIFIEDEDRFLQLFQHAPVGISEVDAHTNKFIRVNPKLCQMLGYTQEELLDRTTQELTHPDDRALDKEFIDKWKLGDPILYHREKRYLCKNGRIIWADLNVTPMQDAEGRTLFNLAVVIDITERKELEAELQKIQERFRLATLATRVGVWEYDLKTDRYWASESLDLIFGHTDPIEKWNRRIFMDQIHPADRDEVDVGIQKAMTNKSGWDLEFRVIWPDQTLHWLNAKGQVLLDEKGHPISMTGTTFEISEKKKAEFEREHLFSQLQTEKQSLEESKELLQATVGDLVQKGK